MFDRFNSDSRAVMMFAAQEAKDLAHREIGTDHLMLGMLCNARSPLFAVLADQGLTLAGAREVVGKNREAEPEDVRDRYEDDRVALRSIGIDLDKVREAVGDRFGEDLAEGWGRRPERGRGRGRGPHGRRGPHHGGPTGGPGGWSGPFRAEVGPDGIWFGPAEGGRGRRGPRGRGRGGRLTEPAREAIRATVATAREAGDSDLRVERLLLAMLDGGDPAVIAVVESATTVDQLRDAVMALLQEAPAAG
ncbi:Clp protease N-terminal domain-containing protein [Gordonia sp. (in: high G+C Gram-positive bacteria)]|uniref:Clp protease N-terminal domain-containing protein n=1 Tax=Gordonia sp. (in: high G+C Gram-positive bacteria) TaxID=84139 RepID=UPI00169025B1|nr:Clp protease N-terminal domain-containing protein [Gordonia sp. (in: high G+C Gram-positive bacteria)]NLG45523.1 Clp protease [Gordonia sp. (in: high G+C Gram-positive bacteria)]